MERLPQGQGPRCGGKRRAEAERVCRGGEGEGRTWGCFEGWSASRCTNLQCSPILQVPNL